MRVIETRQLFEQACEYPIEHETLVDQFGTVPLDPPMGESTALETVLDRCQPTVYESPDDVFTTLMGNLADDFVGRKYYDDRGGAAGDPHPEAEHVAF